MTNTLKNRPILQACLWLKAATQVFRQRTLMLWLFYFTTAHENNF